MLLQEVAASLERLSHHVPDGHHDPKRWVAQCRHRLRAPFAHGLAVVRPGVNLQIIDDVLQGCRQIIRLLGCLPRCLAFVRVQRVSKTGQQLVARCAQQLRFAHGDRAPPTSMASRRHGARVLHCVAEAELQFPDVEDARRMLPPGVHDLRDRTPVPCNAFVRQLLQRPLRDPERLPFDQMGLVGKAVALKEVATLDVPDLLTDHAARRDLVRAMV
eukprot:1033292-Lingulodinium_polyedra.AAC.2